MAAILFGYPVNPIAGFVVAGGVAGYEIPVRPRIVSHLRLHFGSQIEKLLLLKRQRRGIRFHRNRQARAGVVGMVYLDNIRTGYTCGIGGSWGVVKLTLTSRTA